MADDPVKRLLTTGAPYFTSLVKHAHTHATSAWATQPKLAPSPIEELLATAFCILGECGDRGFGFVNEAGATEEMLLQSFGVWRRKEHVWCAVAPEVWMGEFRVDFLALYDCPRRPGGIVVECDGHAFHERTKEQASSDRRRDRELQKYGYHVFRFTGSDVWADAMSCAQQVYESALRFAKQARSTAA